MRLLLRPSTRAYRGLLASAFGLPWLVVRSETAVATDLVAVFKALGGGWEAEARQDLVQPATDALALPAGTEGLRHVVHGTGHFDR